MESAHSTGTSEEPGLPATKSTIVAISSPPGPAQRGVLRVSGPEAGELLLRTLRPRDCTARQPDLWSRELTQFLAQRGLQRARFDDGVGTQPVLVLWMPGPHSYTREDVLELHLPGAQPLLDAALARLLSLGARQAQRGEFTRRAFLNGRIDLTRAEGVLELVSASSELEARAATELLSGGLEQRVDHIRAELEALRALAEASLDFDESDTGHVPHGELSSALAELRRHLVDALGWEVRRQSPSSLPRIVLVGEPNAGKSTLFNALVGRGDALVSNQAGTTRDVLIGIWELASGPVLLVDTAGQDEAAQGVAGQAQVFAAQAARDADLLLHLREVSPPASPTSVAAFDDEAEPLATPFGATEVPVLQVLTKLDLREPSTGLPSGTLSGPKGAVELQVAVLAGVGLEALGRGVEVGLGRDLAHGSGALPSPAKGNLGAQLFLRHRAALMEALASVDRAQEDLRAGAPLDLLAETLREGTDALDTIGGSTSPEDLLDRIFARFCLGK